MLKNPYMERAIELAVENARSGRGGPFGAVVVRDGRILAEGTNQVTFSRDPTAHAEIVAIREACRVLGDFQLRGCEIYTSCEPCPMCLGDIYWARPDRVYFAASREDAAAFGFDDALIYSEVAAPVEDRKICMLALLRERGREAFEEWDKRVDKIRY